MGRSRSESSLNSSSHDKSGSASGSDQPWQVADRPTGRPAVDSSRGYVDQSPPANMHKVFSSSQESSAAESSLSSDNISARNEPEVEQQAGEGAKWSAGSDLHHLGQCSPCAWNWRPAGCVNGSHCLFCHMCLEGEIKQRRKNRLVKLKGSKKAVASAADGNARAQLALQSQLSQIAQQDPSGGSLAQVDRRRNLTLARSIASSSAQRRDNESKLSL